MLVLGIDPGTTNTGFGVVTQKSGRLLALNGGVIKTVNEMDVERRLEKIHREAGELLDEYSPDALAIESIYFGQNVSTAFGVGQARGVVLLAAAQRNIKCYSYTPQAIKSSVCGSGSAGKDQVQRMVQTLLSLEELPKPDHAADALAVGICHLNRAPLQRSILAA